MNIYEKSGEQIQQRETKFAPVAIDEISLGGQFSGYASVFGQVDMGNDIVARGAFAKCLRKHKSSQIRMLFQHNPDEPIGIWREIREDAKGLFVSGTISSKTTRGRELIELMHQGAIDGLSIGFKTVRSNKNKSSGLRTILEAELWEISIVTFPMQEDARVLAIKNAHTGRERPTIRQFEYWLTRDVGLSRSEAKTVISKGFTQLTGTRDAANSKQAMLANSISRAAQTLAVNAATYRSIS